MRHFTARRAAVTLVTVLFAACVSTAGQAAQAARANSDPSLCDNQATSMCFSDHHSAGLIVSEPLALGSANQQTEEGPEGTVTSTYPFQDGLGLNDMWKGNPVVDIEMTGHGECADNSGGSLVPGPCQAGHGYLEVEVTDANGYVSFIDVVASNQASGSQPTTEYVYNPGTGEQLGTSDEPYANAADWLPTF